MRLVDGHVIKSIAADEVSKIFYFGTGCSSQEQKLKVSSALKQLFLNAEVSVDHDIKGAVIATCGNQKGIACIIGTGSNAVYFDGENITENNYGLGYILADEGAGTYLGKKLITNYLYGILPEKLSADFKNRYNLSRNDVIVKVYNNPTANTWLGSFAEFYSSHREDQWVIDTIKSGFLEFVELYVMGISQYISVPVHFVGSIAFNFQDLLREIASDKKFTIGKIIRKPIDGLEEYYSKNIT